MQSCRTVLITPAKSRRGARLWALACAALVLVWGRVLMPTPQTAAQGNVPTFDASIEETLQSNLHTIQWHDHYDSVLLRAIELVGALRDQRAIDPLIDAWTKRNERQLEDIQHVFKKLSIKERNERDDALLVEHVIDQIIDEINTALEHLNIDREVLIQINRKAVNKGSAKAIAILVKYEDTDAIPLILSLLQKGDDKVKNYNAALDKLGADRESIFQANMKALTGWNVQATLDILGTLGDRRAIGPVRRLLETAEPVHTDARAALQKLGASWYAQRSDAERFGLWLGAFLACRALWRAARMLWHPLRRSTHT
jgi:HEAT repeat protein